MESLSYTLISPPTHPSHQSVSKCCWLSVHLNAERTYACSPKVISGHLLYSGPQTGFHPLPGPSAHTSARGSFLQPLTSYQSILQSPSVLLYGTKIWSRFAKVNCLVPSSSEHISSFSLSPLPPSVRAALGSSLAGFISSLHQFHLPKEVILGPLDRAELLPPPDLAFLISLRKHISPLPAFTASLTARSLAYLCLLFVHCAHLPLQSKLLKMTPSWFSYLPVAITEQLLKNAERVTWAAVSLSLPSGVCWAKGHCYLITVSVTGHLLLPLLSNALFNIVCAFPSMQSLHQQVLKALPLPLHYCCLLFVTGILFN